MKFVGLFFGLLFVLIGCVQAQTPGRAGVTGTVSDGKTLLAGATVTIEETQQSAVTDSKGEFSFTLRPGDYTLKIHYVGYKLHTRRITVGPGQMLKLGFPLATESKMLGAVNVQATRKATTVKALLELRRASTNIQDAIGAVQIEKSASITTAQALQRVTGVSVKDGKYITVRGLSDRNVVVQLNGSRLAGADASRSSVALDLIPAQLLENIIVEKSITPDKPGDANGAVVEIRTRSIPDARFFVVSAQTGLNGNIGLGGYVNSFSGGDMGFLGQNVHKLGLTGNFKALIEDYSSQGFSVPLGTMAQGLTQGIQGSSIDQAHYAEALRINSVMEKGFSSVLTPTRVKGAPDQIYGITYGNKYGLSNGKVIGLILGLNYYNRTTSNPNGQNNLYSVAEPTSTGAPSGPNIVYPNELRLIPIYHLNENTGDHQLNYGGLATLAFRFNAYNELSFTYNGNFGTETVSTLENGVANPNLTITDPSQLPIFPNHQALYDFILHSTQRSLNSYQLKGEHKFELGKKWRPWQLSYTLSRSKAHQDDPDYRDTRMRVDSLGRIVNPLLSMHLNGLPQYIPSEYQYTYFAEADRYYRTLDETNDNDKIDLTIPLKLGKTMESFLKGGAYYYGRNRNYQETLFTRSDLSPVALNSQGGYSQVAGDLTTLNGDLSAWAGPGQIGIAENQNVSEGSSFVPGYLYVPQAGITTIPGTGQVFINSYHGKEDVTAYYAMADLNLDSAWRLIGGIRVENTSFQSTPDTSNANFSGLTAIYDKQDFIRQYVTNYLDYNWLPSGSIVYRGIKNVNFRLAYSKTLIRPEMNEIVLSAQRDPIQELTIYGNNKLKNGIFSNYDFRTDWFIGEDELISGSLFYKTVTDQLERVYTNGNIDAFGFQNSFVTFRNNPNIGRVYGLEVEVRKNLGQLFPMGKFFYLGANLMLATSRTRLDSTEYYVLHRLDRGVSWYRPLVDQPNLALNVNMDFDYPKWGTQLNVQLNKTGKRLSDINSDGSPNIYEFPPAILDAVLSQKITKRLEFKAFVKNLLNSTSYYRYTNAGNSKTFGVDNQQYIRRSFNYGTIYTVGFKYTF